MATLYYFDGRGRGEIVRLTLAAAGIDFQEELAKERNQYLKWINDGKLLFGQLPMLEIDGKQMVQTNAIVRYLGCKAGLFGKDENERAMIDQYFEGARDFMSPSYSIGFIPESEVLTGVKEKTLPKYLPIFEKIAAGNGTGYLIGNKLTIADISLLEPLLVYTEYLGKEILEEYPALQKFFSVVTSLENISKFLKGPQRKRKNDERYISEVKKVLDRK